MNKLIKTVELAKSLNVNVDVDEFYKDLAHKIANSVKFKKPKTKENHVGIEIEFDSPSEFVDIYSDIVKLKLHNKVDLGFDCSVYSEYHSNEYGFEIRIIDTEKNIKSTLKKVCKILRDHKAITTEECGLHIHLDGRHRDKHKMFKNFIKAQNLLYRLVSSERIRGEYSSIQDIDYPCTSNPHSYGVELSDFDTVEIRIHHGTVDFDEINNWINILIKIANKKTEYKKFKTYKQIIYLTNFDKPIKKYIQKTINEDYDVESILADYY